MSLIADKVLDPTFGPTYADAPKGSDARKDMENVNKLLREVPRFALSEKASRFICALPKSLTPETVASIKMPYGAFWVETPWEVTPQGKNRWGILYVGAGTVNSDALDPKWAMLEGELNRGALVVMAEGEGKIMVMTFSLDLEAATRVEEGDSKIGPIIQMQPETYSALRVHFGGTPRTEPVHPDEEEQDDTTTDIFVLDFIKRMGLFAASFALTLSAPKVYDRREVDFIALNKQRAKKGRPALLDHTVINITMDPPGTKHVYHGPTGSGGKRRLHFVRFFTRIVNGKLQAVSPHTRGDPTVGTKPTSYKVK